MNIGVHWNWSQWNINWVARGATGLFCLIKLTKIKGLVKLI